MEKKGGIQNAQYNGKQVSNQKLCLHSNNFNIFIRKQSMPSMIKSHQETYPNCVNLLKRLPSHSQEPQKGENKHATQPICILTNFTTISYLCCITVTCNIFDYTKTCQILTSDKKRVPGFPISNCEQSEANQHCDCVSIRSKMCV